jgi:hypothetical protein
LPSRRDEWRELLGATPRTTLVVQNSFCALSFATKDWEARQSDSSFAGKRDELPKAGTDRLAGANFWKIGNLLE